MGDLVEVWTDIGQKKPKPLLARIVSCTNKHKTIQYLSPTDEYIKGKLIYRYEDDTYDIGEDSIYKYHTHSTEYDLGYHEVPEGYVKEDSDIDYVPSDPEEDDVSPDDSEEECDEYEEEDEYYDDEE